MTAIRDPAAIAVRHVADSLTALPVLQARGVDGFVDLGSGGGFPGIPLASALPASRAILVDSVTKKARFLTTVAEAIGLAGRVTVLPARAEDVARDPGQRISWPALTARAVASMGELIELGLPLLRAGGVLVAWKRGEPGDAAGLGAELAGARQAIAAIDPAARIEVGSAADHPDLAGHRLVLVERGPGPVAASWPRDPAARRRAPWGGPPSRTLDR